MWKVKFTKKADKDFAGLSPDVRKRIDKAIYSKLLVEPDNFLISLVGDMSGLYKFRVGDFRLLCSKEENYLIINVIKIAHRSEAYKH
jgi:mRNA interferase RelE/StbE